VEAKGEGVIVFLSSQEISRPFSIEQNRSSIRELFAFLDSESCSPQDDRGGSLLGRFILRGSGEDILVCDFQTMYQVERASSR